jgi:hypothetical protein
MLTRWRALTLLVLVALSGCAGLDIKPCDGLPHESVGPCTVGDSPNHSDH